jgi:signal transduction histidine kinase
MRAIRNITAAVRSSLKTKLVLVIVAILGLTIGLAPWAAIKMQERQLLQASHEHLRTLHAMVRQALVDACMLTRDPASMQQLLEAVGRHQDVEGVRLFDTHGVIRYSSHPEERGRQLSKAELSRFYGHPDPVLLRDGGNVTHTLVQPMFNQDSCVSCHPADQKILGILQVGLSLDPMWRQLDVLKRWAFVATLITLGVVGIGVWLSLTYFVDQPLQQLVEVMGRAEVGELAVRVNTRKGDELGRLGRHFNEMISKLDVAQQELQRYHQEQMARADRLATIGEMAAAMAHEIRNPLTGISGVLSVLSRGFPEDDPRREIVRQTQALIDRLNKSVENILNYSRPSSPQLRAVKIDEIVEPTLAFVQGEAKKARVQVVKEGDAQLPMVNVDPQQIQQVLMNLVLNAIQATAAGGRVRIRTHESENDRRQKQVCIEVQDSGKGMSPQEAAKAFQPFFSTKPQGTGLGLAIAKQIIEQHHGRISLRSAPGEGTCVAVELPAHDPTSQGT